MNKNIQAMPLGKETQTGTYIVEDMDEVVEFLADGDVIIDIGLPTASVISVLLGGRYAIVRGTKTITFNGTFNIG